MLVLKERKTRFILAARLAGKSAAETVAVMMAVFRRLDPRLRASITFDNDTAFARHGLLASACAIATWFCDAYASWQKGAVENANGRLRRDLPRDALSDAELQEIVLSHNLTPRKCLGFLTRSRRYSGSLAETSRSALLNPLRLVPESTPFRTVWTAQRKPRAISRGRRPSALRSTICARRTVKASVPRKPASSRARSSALGSRTKMGGCMPSRCEASSARTRGPMRMLNRVQFEAHSFGRGSG